MLFFSVVFGIEDLIKRIIHRKDPPKEKKKPLSFSDCERRFGRH